MIFSIIFWTKQSSSLTSIVFTNLAALATSTVLALSKMLEMSNYNFRKNTWPISSDLIGIDLTLQANLEERVNNKPPLKAADLKKSIKSQWNLHPASYTKKLAKSNEHIFLVLIALKTWFFVVWHIICISLCMPSFKSLSSLVCMLELAKVYLLICDSFFRRPGISSL